MNNHAGWFWQGDRMVCVWCGKHDSDSTCVSEHPPECNWHRDWHDCNCGLFDKCEEVIPGTTIMCGEGGNYCSIICMRKKDGVQ